MPIKEQTGFTLVELVSVLVIIGILAGVAASRSIPHSTLQLQAGRDIIISALFIAQQKAMSQADDIQVITTASTLDIRQDKDDDGNFDADESIRYAGTAYPIGVPGGVTIGANQISYDRLGRTTSNTITLSKASESITITITGTGYAY